MSRRRQLSDEERTLWKNIARSVKPLRKIAEAVEPLSEAAGEVAAAKAAREVRRCRIPSRRFPHRGSAKTAAACAARPEIEAACCARTRADRSASRSAWHDAGGGPWRAVAVLASCSGRWRPHRPCRHRQRFRRLPTARIRSGPRTRRVAATGANVAGAAGVSPICGRVRRRPCRAWRPRRALCAFAPVALT